MIGVLVKDGSVIVSKDVYGGDDEESLKVVVALADKNKALTFEVHKDSDANWKTAFEAASVPVKVTSEQSSWQTEKAKGPDAAINFIANKIGLQ